MSKARPEVLFIDQSGQIGGAELCLADVAAAFGVAARVLLLQDGPFAALLRRRGVAVDVVAMDRAWGGLGKSAGVGDFARRAPALLRGVAELRREIARSDIVYFNTAKALALGRLASTGLGVRRIFHLHDLATREHFSAANLRVLTGAANRCDAVIANSRATADAFRAAGGRAVCEVIPNGFDPAEIDAVTDAQIAAHRKTWNPDNAPVVAVFGRLARWKGQDVVMRAVERLPGVCLWIVGAPLFTEDDRQFAAELEAAARRLGGRVRLAGFRDDVALWMRSADVVVHSSVAAEPFGRVLVEAMFAGKPVVASAAGGPCEIVDDGVTGCLVPPGDPVALARAVAALLEDPAAAAAMGRAGRVRAGAKFSLSVVLEQTRLVVYSNVRQ